MDTGERMLAAFTVMLVVLSVVWMLMLHPTECTSSHVERVHHNAETGLSTLPYSGIPIGGGGLHMTSSPAWDQDVEVCDARVEYPSLWERMNGQAK